MPRLKAPLPYTPVEPVTETLHGVPITDPYRWLEDQESPRTRAWLAAQAEYARAYLEAIPGRERIRQRIRELLDVETSDSIQKVGSKYVFRKRTPGQEQPCIFIREGLDGTDQMLLDPARRGTGKHTAVAPVRVSRDGTLLLYEVKEGGERSGTFEILDIENHKTLPDVLPRGYLRGFAFASDSQSFYYVHEALNARRPDYRAAFHHVLGTQFSDDGEVFSAGESKNLRLTIVPGTKNLGFLTVWFLDKAYTSFWLWPLDGGHPPQSILANAAYRFIPVLHHDRILANTDRDAANSRIVELRPRAGQEAEFVDVIPTTDVPIRNWVVTENRICVSYTRGVKTQVRIFDPYGKHTGDLPIEEDDTIRLNGRTVGGEDELLFEQESFTKPTQVYSYSLANNNLRLLARRKVPFDAGNYGHTQVWFRAQDGTRVPMFLVGCHKVLEKGPHPTIMTSYGGYGIPMTPQFSVLVAFLLERRCLFALPNIRGGCEFGVEWHNAARRRKRQVAFCDFLDAAEWLVETGRTESRRFAIFGGSNSGLLVGAAMTQRPELFRAVVCMAPMLDMLRYHLFDNAHIWKEEFGTADDPDDFRVLASYSPYQRVREGTAYPASMIVSGDVDQNCNPLHSRKMTARLQAANVSPHPIFLDYSPHRGHSPVLPLTERIEGLTDRVAFLCDQLDLPV